MGIVQCQASLNVMYCLSVEAAVKAQDRALSYNSVSRVHGLCTLSGKPQ